MAKKTVKPLAGQGIPQVVDPNPARTASDDAEATAKTEQKDTIAQANAADGQAYLDGVQATADAEILAEQEKQDAANLASETNISDGVLINILMEDLGVTTLYENSKQEYFTSLNLAINSEGGVKDRVRTHNKGV